MPGGAFWPLMISTAVIWIISALAIRFEFYRLHRAHLQGQHPRWYARPMFWFAASGLTLGLILLSLVSIFLFSRSVLLPGHYALYLIMVLIFLFPLLFCGGIIVALERPFDKKDSPLTQEYFQPSDHPSLQPVARTSIIAHPFLAAMLIGASITSVGTILWYILEKPSAFLLTLLFLLLVLLVRLIILQYASRRLNQRRYALTIPLPKPFIDARFQHFDHEANTFERRQLLLPPLVVRLKWQILYGYCALFAAYILASLPHQPVLIYSILITLSFSLSYLIFPLRSARESVEATSEGLVVSQGIWIYRQKRFQQLMRWQDARLFICYPTPGLLGLKGSMTYEISSPLQVLRWTHVTHPRSFWMPWRLEVSSDEYNQRIQALCACITGQTGLELHMLNQERPSKQERAMLITR